jgi:hypothetical protein
MPLIRISSDLEGRLTEFGQGAGAQHAIELLLEIANDRSEGARPPVPATARADGKTPRGAYHAPIMAAIHDAGGSAPVGVIVLA